LTGVDKDAVEVRAENDVLTIDGSVDFSKYQGLSPVYTEYNVGNYARSFQLSNKIDQERISAELQEGVITLTLPRAERAKPRKVKVG
jgi:HSP20 family protein